MIIIITIIIIIIIIELHLEFERYYVIKIKYFIFLANHLSMYFNENQHN